LTKIPVISGEEAIKALMKAGYYRRRQKGSHVRLYHETKQPVTVPLGKTLKKGTLRGILRTAEIGVEEFIELLTS
jgi:predicted RNA binding protein YcfA (HicA-like mRNA interferase family)